MGPFPECLNNIILDNDIRILSNLPSLSRYDPRFLLDVVHVPPDESCRDESSDEEYNANNERNDVFWRIFILEDLGRITGSGTISLNRAYITRTKRPHSQRGEQGDTISKGEHKSRGRGSVGGLCPEGENNSLEYRIAGRRKEDENVKYRTVCGEDQSKEHR